MSALTIRPTRVEIDLDAVVANAAHVASLVAPRAGVLAVVKADAYGHGAIEVARALRDHAPILGLAVSLAEEGFELRRAGVEGPILVMGAVYGTLHREVAAHGLTPVVSELADVAAFARGAAPLGVHLKLDTGMSRLGVRAEGLGAFLDALAAHPGVRLTGFMTHLASADSDPELTRVQLERFAAALPAVRAAAGPGAPLVLHAANSAATMLREDARLDAVRPGLAVYGGGGWAGLRPAMRFVTAIVSLRDLAPGDTVSYGATWRAPARRRIATLPVGYADGYPRRLSGTHQSPAEGPTSVLVRGRRCPVVGTVCMDMLMIDVTDLGDEVALGDEAVLIGTQGSEAISAAELARRAGLIEYEITCGISKRVPRLYRPVRI